MLFDDDDIKMDDDDIKNDDDGIENDDDDIESDDEDGSGDASSYDIYGSRGPYGALAGRKCPDLHHRPKALVGPTVEMMRIRIRMMLMVIMVLMVMIFIWHFFLFLNGSFAHICEGYGLGL